jgi:hypothetical protein
MHGERISNRLHNIAEGDLLLESHRSNYGPDGPQYYAVLLWECLPLHWEDLYIGASVNFVKVPIPMKETNGPFIREQLAIAETFVDELITLRVLELVPETTTLVNTCPLFFVPKRGKPGQW